MLENNPKLILEMVNLLSKESKCAKTSVGAMFVKGNKILGNGVNGTPSGHINCNQVFKKDEVQEGQSRHQEHKDWSSVNELHAEFNALKSVGFDEDKLKNSILVVNKIPCQQCQKLLSAFEIKHIYYYDKDDIGMPLLEEMGYQSTNLYQAKEEFVTKEMTSNIKMNLINQYVNELINANSFILTDIDFRNIFGNPMYEDISYTKMEYDEETIKRANIVQNIIDTICNHYSKYYNTGMTGVMQRTLINNIEKLAHDLIKHRLVGVESVKFTFNLDGVKSKILVKAPKYQSKFKEPEHEYESTIATMLKNVLNQKVPVKVNENALLNVLEFNENNKPKSKYIYNNGIERE